MCINKIPAPKPWNNPAFATQLGSSALKSKEVQGWLARHISCADQLKSSERHDHDLGNRITRLEVRRGNRILFGW